MSPRPKDAAEAPEAFNSEQDDGPQAQDVAEDALHPEPALQDSVHGPSDRTSLYDDEPDDLVDVIVVDMAEPPVQMNSPTPRPACAAIMWVSSA